jgi:hypothetical protein
MKIDGVLAGKYPISFSHCIQISEMKNQKLANYEYRQGQF